MSIIDRANDLIYEIVDDVELQPGQFAAHTECRYCHRDCGPNFGGHTALTGGWALP